MSIRIGQVGLALSAAALMSVAACSGKDATIDSGLEKDLAAVNGTGSLDLAPNSSVSPNLVISAEEAGATAAPAPATHKVVPRPSVKPSVRVAEKVAPAPMRMPDPVITQRAPAPEPVKQEPAPREVEPAPLPPAAPAQGRSQQKGVYKTEGQIFQQMPWIRP